MLRLYLLDAEILWGSLRLSLWLQECPVRADLSCFHSRLCVSACFTLTVAYARCYSCIGQFQIATLIAEARSSGLEIVPKPDDSVVVLDIQLGFCHRSTTQITTSGPHSYVFPVERSAVSSTPCPADCRLTFAHKSSCAYIYAIIPGERPTLDVRTQ